MLLQLLQHMVSGVAFDWRATLGDVAPHLGATEKRSDQTGEYVADNMALLREHGFFGLAVPSELGGAGLLPSELAEFLRTLARVSSATALTMAMHTRPRGLRRLAVAPPEGGSRRPPETDRRRAVADPDVGRFGLAGRLGTATKVKDDYKVNGRKVFASGAPSADLFMTMAVEQAPEGPTVMHCAVPLTSP